MPVKVGFDFAGDLLTEAAAADLDGTAGTGAAFLPRDFTPAEEAADFMLGRPTTVADLVNILPVIADLVTL